MKIPMWVEYLAATIYGILFAVLVVWGIDGRTPDWNCEVAEFSPDIPTEIKKECRNARSR